ncbi:hypothetical protein SteCoe_36349 [Stentor coeruleus]|uniref:Uncharacterized protein n=1 Tax=Stentor coeruleus TaxID=5963 RepID=A0A1R2AQC9_9CILI|nr:hypothetical protein SteCoe_36349 [Stentor coeruleus]
MDTLETNFLPIEDEFKHILKPCSIFSVIALALFIKIIMRKHCLSIYDNISSRLDRAIAEIEKSSAEDQKFLSHLYKTCISSPGRLSLKELCKYCSDKTFYHKLECISNKITMCYNVNKDSFIENICQELNICIEIDEDIYNFKENIPKILIRLKSTSEFYSLQLTKEEIEICLISEEVYINFFRYPYILITKPNKKLLSNSLENSKYFSEESVSTTNSIGRKIESAPVFQIDKSFGTDDKMSRSCVISMPKFTRFNLKQSSYSQKCKICKCLLNVYNCAFICDESKCHICNKCRFRNKKKCISCEMPYGKYESILKVIKISYGLK